MYPLSDIKKILLFLLPLLPAFLSAQTIPDADFEKWNSLSYSFPVGMQTSGTVTQVNPGFRGNYSIKIQGSQDGIQAGSFGYGSLNGAAFSGGIPFASRPDSVTGYFASHIALHDTAWMFVILKSGGNIIGSDSVFITQSNTAFYSKFKSPLHYRSATPPDSLIFLVFSTCPRHINDSTYLLADELGFTHSSVPLPNGDLESWYKRSYQDPKGWSTPNYLGLSAARYPVADTMDAFAGKASCRLTSFNVGAYSLNGVTWLGKMKNGVLKPGFPVNQKDTMLLGYYKFQPANGDSGTVMLQLFRHDSLVGSGSLYLEAPASNWTPFVVPVTYLPSFTGTPDSAAILIAAYKWTSSSSPSRGHSILEVDELNFNSFATGIQEEGASPTAFQAFPNPFRDFTELHFSLPEAAPVSVSVYDGRGSLMKTLAETLYTSGEHVLILEKENMHEGIYFVVLRSADRVQTRKISVLR